MSISPDEEEEDRCPCSLSFDSIENCINFRSVCPDFENGAPDLPFRLYRSSRPDLLTQKEVDYILKDLKIKCILDMRSVREYRKASGDKLLDQHFNISELKYPECRNYHPKEEVDILPIDSKSSDCKVHHYMLDIFGGYAWIIFKRAPWYIWIYSIFVLLYDLLFNKGFHNFIRLYTTRVLNPGGILGQYKDIIEECQPSLAAALKLLTDPQNVPALLNCTHGKDRTGVLSALILACLGKDKCYIAKNYAISEQSPKLKPILQEEIVERYRLSESFASAKEETMLSLFEFIEEKYGNVSNYLEYIGFSSEEQRQLYNNLCEKK